jgi:superkiller protein 3
MGQAIVTSYHFFRGEGYLDERKYEKGLEEFYKAAEISSFSKEVLNNLGSACAEKKLYDEAIAFFKQALEIDPEYEMARKNLDKIHKHLEK